MDTIYDNVLAAAQEAYDHFKESHPVPGPDDANGIPGKASWDKLQVPNV